MMTHLGLATLGFYAASLACYVRFLYENRRPIGRAATLTLAAGVLVHYLALLERSRWVHSVPYQDLYGSMSLFAWLLAVTYLGLELLHRQRSVGPFVLPFVLLLFVLANLAPATPPPPPARGALFALHVTLDILAYSAFALSFVLSLIYLLQNRVLRDRRLSTVFWRFPALEVLERMSRSSVMVGLASLGIGMVLGFVWVNRIRGRYWSADPKEIATLLIVALYAGYLWLARTTTWRGARASMICVCNFLFVLFSYTVVNLYLSHYHRYL
ncbi:MAG TPA: cytochrome c biogenesis protein CcsA [Candidatus Acidoferrales bacterium]|nr:cytochrome c biogenesis protein CcsA [Candidatus Acidoferrales bacterium]